MPAGGLKPDPKAPESVYLGIEPGQQGGAVATAMMESRDTAPPELDIVSSRLVLDSQV